LSGLEAVQCTCGQECEVHMIDIPASAMQPYLTSQMDGSVGQPFSLNTQWFHVERTSYTCSKYHIDIWFFSASLSLLDNRVCATNQATCFSLNYVIFRLWNNFKKHTDEDNIQLIAFCSEHFLRCVEQITITQNGVIQNGITYGSSEVLASSMCFLRLFHSLNMS
jgi:hypothetical protein